MFWLFGYLCFIYNLFIYLQSISIFYIVSSIFYLHKYKFQNISSRRACFHLNVLQFSHVFKWLWSLILFVCKVSTVNVLNKKSDNLTIVSFQPRSILRTPPSSHCTIQHVFNGAFINVQWKLRLPEVWIKVKFWFTAHYCRCELTASMETKSSLCR